MPRLKDLECSVELTGPQCKLQEHMSTYSDGVVETFIAVPSEPRAFAVHLRSTAFIAEGLAMYVFIDGVYQCNRNRRGLESQTSDKGPARRNLVDFLVRQKEERQVDGEMIAREWRFEKLNTSLANQASKNCSRDNVKNVGCIEIVVLRCKGNRVPSKNMDMDGANDSSYGDFGERTNARQWSFDDRGLHIQHTSRSRERNGSTSGATDVRSPKQSRAQSLRGHASSYDGHTKLRSHWRPSSRPPSVRRSGSHRSHGADGPTSQAGNSEIPAGSYHYGTGPIRRADFAESKFDQFRERTPSQIRTENIIDPGYLKRITKRAYQEGLKEARHSIETERQPKAKHNAPAFDATSQFPENWNPAPKAQASRDDTNLVPERHLQEQVHQTVNDWGTTDDVGNWKEGATQGGWNLPKKAPDSPDSWQTSTWGTHNDSPPDKSNQPETEAIRFPSWASVPAVSVQNGFSNRSAGWAEVDNGWNVSHSDTPSEPESNSTVVASFLPFPQVIAPTFGAQQEKWSNRQVPEWSTHKPRPSLDFQGQSLQWNGGTQENNDSNADSWPPSASQVNPQGPLNEHPASQSRHRDDLPKGPQRILPPIPIPLGTPNTAPPPPYSTTPPVIFRVGTHSENASTRNWRHGNNGSNTAQDVEVKGSRTMPGSWNNEEWNKSPNNNLKDGWKMFTSASTGLVQDPANNTWGAAKSSGWSADTHDSKVRILQNNASWTSHEKDQTNNQHNSSWNKQNWNNWDPPLAVARVGNDLGKQAWGSKNNASADYNANLGDSGEWDVQSLNNGSGWKQDNNSAGIIWTNATSGWDKPHDSDNKQQMSLWNEDTQSPAPKGRLRSYRRLHNRSDNTHWRFPPAAPKDLDPVPEEHKASSDKPRETFSLPEETLCPIPMSVAKKKHIEHQVLAGKGTRYTHAIGRPEYIDSLEHPYAVFRFKYRTRACLKKMFPGAIPNEEPKMLVDELKDLSEQEKIAEIIKLKEMLAGMGVCQEKDKVSETDTTAAPTHVRGWVKDQQQRSQRNSNASASNSPSKVLSNKKGSAQVSHKSSKNIDDWAKQTWPDAANGAPGTAEITKGGPTNANDQHGTGGMIDDSWKKSGDEEEGGGATGKWDSGEVHIANTEW